MDWKKRAMTWQRLTYVEPEDSPWQRWVKSAVEWLTGREKVQRLYRQLQLMEVTHPHDLWGEALRLMDIQYTVYGAAVESIPPDGPLVFIANHPFGIADGLIAADLMGRVRKDFKVMVNRVLMHQDPRLRPYLLPVDFNPGSTALQVNLATRQQALQCLRDGHALVLFPSGGVATAPGGWGQARELPWKRFAAKAVQVAEATVVCAWFHGQNSRWFQLASQCSRSLRLGLLLHELRNKMGTRLHVCLGEPITYASVAHLKNRQELLAFLQERTEQLGREHNKRM